MHLVAEIEVGVDVDDTEVLLHRPVNAPVGGDRHRVVAADHGKELSRLHGLIGQLLRLGEHLVPVLPHAVTQILDLHRGDIPEILGGGRDGVGDFPQLLGRLTSAGAEADPAVVGDTEHSYVASSRGSSGWFRPAQIVLSSVIEFFNSMMMKLLSRPVPGCPAGSRPGHLQQLRPGEQVVSHARQGTDPQPGGSRPSSVTVRAANSSVCRSTPPHP